MIDEAAGWLSYLYGPNTLGLGQQAKGTILSLLLPLFSLRSKGRPVFATVLADYGITIEVCGL